MKKLFLPIALLMLGFVVVQCSKEGPAGPQGDEGPAGPTGPRGNVGATGTANVIYGTWASFQQAERDTTIDGTNLKVNHIAASQQLTQGIIDNGIVLMYMRFGATVFPLPYTSRAGSRPNTVSFVPRPGRIFVTRFTHDNATPYLGFGSVQFRYVLVPGGVAGGRFADGEKRAELNGEIYTETELKYMPYEQVCSLLGVTP